MRNRVFRCGLRSTSPSARVKRLASSVVVPAVRAETRNADESGSFAQAGAIFYERVQCPELSLVLQIINLSFAEVGFVSRYTFSARRTYGYNTLFARVRVRFACSGHVSAKTKNHGVISRIE